MVVSKKSEKMSGGRKHEMGCRVKMVQNERYKRYFAKRGEWTP